MGENKSVRRGAFKKRTIVLLEKLACARGKCRAVHVCLCDGAYSAGRMQEQAYSCTSEHFKPSQNPSFLMTLEFSLHCPDLLILPIVANFAGVGLRCG